MIIDATNNEQGYGIRAFPNPSSNQVWFEFTSPLSLPIDWSIQSSEGQTIGQGIFEEAHDELNWPDEIPSGTYLLLLKDQNGVKYLVRLIRID